MTLLEAEIMMIKMIDNDPDVTIGEYWKTLNRYKTPIMLAKRYYPTVRKVFERPDPAPFKRLPAQYDNRGHAQLIEEYS